MKKIGITGADGFIGGYLKTCFDGIKIGGNLLARAKIDNFHTIIHCAGRMPFEGVRNVNFIGDNIFATERLVWLANRAKVKRIIYLSTMAIYTLKMYGLSKLVGEECLSEFKGEKIIFRLPRVNPFLLDVDFTKNIQKKYFYKEKNIYIANYPMITIGELINFLIKII
jgi:nucleoside-diphosphate-sugar epimerase